MSEAARDQGWVREQREESEVVPVDVIGQLRAELDETGPEADSRSWAEKARQTMRDALKGGHQ